MTEQRVKAGDRALETARNVIGFVLAVMKTREIPLPAAVQVAELIQVAMNAQERELNAAIGILARLPWCECGHQHVGGEMCMGCDCFQQIPVSREWVVKVVKKLAAERLSR